MKKLLYFAYSTTNQIMINADKIISMEVDADSDAVNITYDDLLSGEVQSTELQITVTSGKADVALEALIEEISKGKLPFITVADNVNNIYLHADITAVGASLNL